MYSSVWPSPAKRSRPTARGVLRCYRRHIPRRLDVSPDTWRAAQNARGWGGWRSPTDAKVSRNRCQLAMWQLHMSVGMVWYSKECNGQSGRRQPSACDQLRGLCCAAAADAFLGGRTCRRTHEELLRTPAGGAGRAVRASRQSATKTRRLRRKTLYKNSGPGPAAGLAIRQQFTLPTVATIAASRKKEV